MTLNSIIANFQTFKLVDLLDILVIAFLIYQLLGIVNRTRAGQLAKGALLVLVAIGCLALVTAGVYQGAMEQLLEEGDYTRQRKSKSRLIGTVSVCYWLIVTAIFMFYTFGPYGNAQPKYSWFIWAIAGILYGAVMAVLRLVGQGEKKK